MLSDARIPESAIPPHFCRWFRFSLLTLVALIVAADNPHRTPNLTTASAKSFADNVGKTVAIEGKITTFGKMGCCFLSPKLNVTFYVIPSVQARAESRYKDWGRYEGKTVCISGLLKFQPAPEPPGDGTSARPPAYYYMVLQDTSIQAAE